MVPEASHAESLPGVRDTGACSPDVRELTPCEHMARVQLQLPQLGFQHIKTRVLCVISNSSSSQVRQQYKSSHWTCFLAGWTICTLAGVAGQHPHDCCPCPTVAQHVG